MIHLFIALNLAYAQMAPFGHFQNNRVLIFSSSTTWTVPADWNDADNTFQCIGGGGGARGARHCGSGGKYGGGGGGGGGAGRSNVGTPGSGGGGV